jgi:hypothetical protein
MRSEMGRGDEMSEAVPNFEGLLREALAPVEPPEDLIVRLESTLTSITELAAEELHEWELSAMRDPRNWVRPAAALVAGTAAGTALVLLRARRRAHASSSGPFGGGRLPNFDRSAAERALRDLGRETRRLLGDR